MPVPGGEGARREIDPGLDRLAPGRAEIVALEIDATDRRRGLRRRAGWRRRVRAGIDLRWGRRLRISGGGGEQDADRAGGKAADRRAGMTIVSWSGLVGDRRPIASKRLT
jgi:hypothetical protein